MTELTATEHKARHLELHRALDELIADFLTHTGKLPSRSTVMELMEWSYQQTIEPGTMPANVTQAASRRWG